MGQASSRQAQPADSCRGRRRIWGLHRKRRRQLTSDADGLQEEGVQSLLDSRPVPSFDPNNRSRRNSRIAAPATILHRQVSARSDPAPRAAEAAEPVTSTQDAVVYEHEERALMSVEDIRISDAPISNITASPMPRSPSVIARISSRLSQRYSSIEPGGPESDENSSTWQLPSPVSLQDGWQSDGSINARSGRSMLGTLADPTPSSSTLRLRRRSAVLGRESILDDNSEHDPIRSSPLSGRNGSAYPNDSTIRSPTRLARVRRSLTGPLEALLSRPTTSRQDRQTTQANSPLTTQPSQQEEAEETEYLLPPINVDTALDLEDRATNTNFETRGRAGTPIPEPSFRSSWSDRWSPRTPTIRREPRRVPNLLRRRSSRVIRREDEMPLSRILQFAAATIAAQLSGNMDAMSNLEAIGDDNFDGSLTNFMDDLSNATGSTQPATEGSSADAQTSLPPLNFWRAFRFMGTNNSPRANTSRDDSEQRTVTLVVVGVRSVLSSSLQREASDGQETNIDSIFDDAPSPALSSNNRSRRPRSFLRSVSGRSSLGAYSRRSSLSAHDPFPAQYESQRHSLAGSQRSQADQQFTMGTAASRELDTYPRLPFQSTASDEALHSDLSPSSNRRNSRPLSTVSDPNAPFEAFMPQRGSQTGDSTSTTHMASEPNTPDPVIHSYGDQPIDREMIPEPPPVRRRRRSDSELARAENLASHRNGTIDPDGGPLMGRSWLIYVVGTNLPADHPIFQVPSLLSDNPTYEDMVTLSNLLGPVRPPVAHPNDVERAGGLFKLVEETELGADDQVGPILRAVPLEGTPGDAFTLATTDNCLVCLSGFAAAEELRELAKCKHRFHRGCIDEWLTTGRNSCPLCRAAGVPREEAANQPEASAPTAA